MNDLERSEKVLRLVNLARASYGAPQLETLEVGEPHSAPFCPIGRSLRRGVDDRLFVTVGSRHLRLWTVSTDPVSVAKQIMSVWGIPHERLKESRDRPGVVMFPLPDTLREFVDEFDRGLLPRLQGQVEQQEVRHLGELASRMPIPVARSQGIKAAEKH